MDNNNSDAPLKVTINGQEYDANEASELMDTGRKTREYEQKYNTTLDKVWPEYGSKSQRLVSIEQELAEAKAQLTEFQSKRVDGSETPTDIQDAKEAARKLGIPFNEDIEKNYIKRDDLPKEFEKFNSQQQAVQQVLNQADKLAAEINGKDGRPRFNKQAVLHYAAAMQKSDLMEAYEEMYAEDLTPWKEAQIASQKTKSLKTLGGGGEKNPNSPRINRDNFKEALSESLHGSQE